jgi:hypothetical protein
LDKRIIKAVRDKEDRLKFYDKITESQFDKMDFTELVFRSEMLDRERYEAAKNQMIAASFTAWQMRAAQGDKTGWNKYQMKLGLSENEHIEKEEAAKVKQTAIDIIKRISGRKK